MTPQAIIGWAEVALTVAWPAVVIAIPFLVALLLKHLKDEGRVKMLKGAIDTAYVITHSVARKTPNGLDDKAAHALKIVSEELGKSLSPEEEKVVRRALQVKHEVVKNPDLLLNVVTTATGKAKSVVGRVVGKIGGLFGR